jgi:hypothetical protein
MVKVYLLLFSSQNFLAPKSKNIKENDYEGTQRKAAAARAEVGLAPSASDDELAQAQMRKKKVLGDLQPPTHLPSRFA